VSKRETGQEGREREGRGERNRRRGWGRGKEKHKSMCYKKGRRLKRFFSKMDDF
jgi:hypothetical protein